MFRARSHRYPDDNSDEEYVDTTYYDRNEKYLDIGFQRLRSINIRAFPGLSAIQTLNIDHNCLESLPIPEVLPHLRKLNCSHNRLRSIPFYPNLTTLIANNNNLSSLKSYGKSGLKFLDCSFNKQIDLMRLRLPLCKKLYITDSEIKTIDMESLPLVEILDCENNQLESLGPSQTLAELNIKSNLFAKLSIYPNLIRLYASKNSIRTIKTFGRIETLCVAHNRLELIEAQPVLTKLNAKHNFIKSVGPMPSLQTVDLSYNVLDSYDLVAATEFAHMHFNPIQTLHIDFSSLKELQIDFKTYQRIHRTYDQQFKLADVSHSMEKLEKILGKAGGLFDDRIIKKVKRGMSLIKFYDRDADLNGLCAYVFECLFGVRDSDMTNREYAKLFSLLEKIYYKTIIITLYFNGHYAIE